MKRITPTSVLEDLQQSGRLQHLAGNGVKTINIKSNTKTVRSGQRESIDRTELKRRLRISKATLGRYLALVAAHVPEFRYRPRQRKFNQFQVFALKWIKAKLGARKSTETVVLLIEEGALIYAYQAFSENRAKAAHYANNQRVA